MKPLNIFLTCLTLIVTQAIFLTAKPTKTFVSTKLEDTSDYKLQIIESAISPLKDTVFNRNECWITHCPLTLTNNSDYMLNYFVATTSWWDLYSLDNNDFELAADYGNVFKNGVEIRSLPPHQSVTVDIRIITYKHYSQGEKLKIAMSIQKPGQYVSQMLMPKTVNQIWSNEVTIN